VEELRKRIESLERERNSGYEDDRLNKLFQDMYLGNGQPSITVRMAQVEHYIATQTKIMWILVAAFVGDIVSRFIK